MVKSNPLTKLKRKIAMLVCYFPELTSASFCSNVARKALSATAQHNRQLRSLHRGSRVRTSLDMDTPAHRKVAQ